MTKPRMALAVLISGNGSNLQALIDASNDSTYPASIACVISNNTQAYGLTRAEKAGIPTHVMSHQDYPDRTAFDQALHDCLATYAVDLICLAGFMRLLSPWFVNQWHNKLVNIHPSLLPAFKGLNTHQATLDSGVRIAGCTVHMVRATMDEGPILVQAAVPVLPDDTAESLARRILAQEHRCYPLAVKLLANKDITLEGDKVMFSDSALNSFQTQDALIVPS